MDDYIYDDFGNKVTEARIWPFNQPTNPEGVIICGIASYLAEIEKRREQNKKNGQENQLPTPKWEDLVVYYKNGIFYQTGEKRILFAEKHE